jgi:hypothetical protein
MKNLLHLNIVITPSKKYTAGFIHHFALALVVVGVAVGGTAYLVASQAQTPTSTIVGPGSKCLDDKYDKLVNGNKIQLYSCNKTGAQKWTVNATTTSGTIANGSYCLNVTDSNTTAGTAVDLYRCNGSSGEQWTVNTATGVIVNPHSGKCLDDRYASTANGTQIQIYNCNGTIAQKWTLTATTTSTPTPTPSPTPPAPSEHLITSLYAYPTSPAWSQVENAASVVKYSIVNICAADGTGSGCGSPADEKNSAWTTTINTLTSDRITPLYYISTNYGAIALSVLESELQNAKTWYGITSPMFDTTATSGTCSNGGNGIACTTYYNDLYSYAVNAGATAVVFNPGAIPPNSYMFGPKEVIQVFEGTASNFEKTSFPTWMSNYPSNEFAATLSGGTATTIGEDIGGAARDNIGNFYEDDENEPPNYSTLPAFWSTEVNNTLNTE